jgi:hypothetical protein
MLPEEADGRGAKLVNVVPGKRHPMCLLREQSMPSHHAPKLAQQDGTWQTARIAK